MSRAGGPPLLNRPVIRTRERNSTKAREVARPAQGRTTGTPTVGYGHPLQPTKPRRRAV